MSLKSNVAVVERSQPSAKRHYSTFLLLPALVLLTVGGLHGSPADSSGGTQNNNHASDPGVRGGPPGAGTPVAGLTSTSCLFSAGFTDFAEIDSVTGSVANTGKGLGPRFNAESCAQCHAQPSTGGTSPSTNPQIAAATDQGARNQVPSFITSNGPVREAASPSRSAAKSMAACTRCSPSPGAAMPAAATFRRITLPGRRNLVT